MASRSSGFSNLLKPALHEIFFNKYSQYPEEYSKVFDVLSSSRAYEEDSEVTGLGKLVSKSEGASITYDDPIQGKTKTYTHSSYGLGFRVTHELFEDDQYGIIKRMPAALARSANQTQEVEAWSVFNNAFSTSYTGLDGKPLCSTTHPNVAAGAGSGPYSNRLSTDSDLSITSLQSAIEAMETTTDDRDLNLMIKPRLLVVPVQAKWMARELLNSEYKPGTANNEINALADEELKYMVGHYLTDTDAWFLLADKADHYLRFFWREKVKFSSDDDFDSGDAKFKVFMRFAVGYSGWRGVVGTPGA
jgi:phage major head subunit gpT-like protein